MSLWLCCTVGYKWVNVKWIVLNLNSIIEKTILSGDSLSVDFIVFIFN